MVNATGDTIETCRYKAGAYDLQTADSGFIGTITVLNMGVGSWNINLQKSDRTAKLGCKWKDSLSFPITVNNKSLDVNYGGIIDTIQGKDTATYTEVNNWAITVANTCDYIGVNEPGVLTEKEIHIYPNPVKNTLHIEKSSDVTGIQVELFNLLEKIKLDTTIYDSIKKIDVAALKGGIYFLRIKHKDQIINRKIIKL